MEKYCGRLPPPVVDNGSHRRGGVSIGDCDAKVGPKVGQAFFPSEINALRRVQPTSVQPAAEGAFEAKAAHLSEEGRSDYMTEDPRENKKRCRDKGIHVFSRASVSTSKTAATAVQRSVDKARGRMMSCF